MLQDKHLKIHFFIEKEKRMYHGSILLEMEDSFFIFFFYNLFAFDFYDGFTDF